MSVLCVLRAELKSTAGTYVFKSASFSSKWFHKCKLYKNDIDILQTINFRFLQFIFKILIFLSWNFYFVWHFLAIHNQHLEWLDLPWGITEDCKNTIITGKKVSFFHFHKKTFKKSQKIFGNMMIEWSFSIIFCCNWQLPYPRE